MCLPPVDVRWRARGAVGGWAARPIVDRLPRRDATTFPAAMGLTARSMGLARRVSASPLRPPFRWSCRQHLRAERAPVRPSGCFPLRSAGQAPVTTRSAAGARRLDSPFGHPQKAEMWPHARAHGRWPAQVLPPSDTRGGPARGRQPRPHQHFRGRAERDVGASARHLLYRRPVVPCRQCHRFSGWIAQGAGGILVLQSALWQRRGAPDPGGARSRGFRPAEIPAGWRLIAVRAASGGRGARPQAFGEPRARGWRFSRRSIPAARAAPVHDPAARRCPAPGKTGAQGVAALCLRSSRGAPQPHREAYTGL